MKPLHWSERAQLDLEDISRYSSQQFGDRKALEFVLHIRGTVTRRVAAFPESGRVRIEFGEMVRSIPIPPYVVFYRIAKKQIEILRVLHGYRDIHAPLISLLVAV